MPPRPNIIVILADDVGFSDLGCYGGEIHTPNLDRLAARGLRFTQFYNTARCCPTRASLLTGLYPHQAAVGHMTEDQGLDGYHGDLSRNAVTIAEVLRTAGYATYAAGKWHVTPFERRGDSKHNWPLQRGFARYYGIIGGAANYFDPDTLVADNRPLRAAADAEYKPAHYYLTDAISDHAVRFIGATPSRKAASRFSCMWPIRRPIGPCTPWRARSPSTGESTTAATSRFARPASTGSGRWESSIPAGTSARRPATGRGCGTRLGRPAAWRSMRRRSTAWTRASARSWRVSTDASCSTTR